MDRKILTAVIVDDETFAVTNLSNLITSYCKSINIINTASNTNSAIK